MRPSRAIRSSREVAAKPSNAALAAATARSTSASAPSAIVANGCSVAGLMTSSVAGEAGATHSPPMKNCRACSSVAGWMG